MSINVATITGVLTREPRMNYDSGTPKARLIVACFDLVKDADGKWAKRRTIIPVVVEGKNAERTAGWLREGMMVEIEGSVRGAKVATIDGFGVACFIAARRVEQVKA
ncbi:MAG: single-stranded DNA-binding protein [Synergistaceae bacterium]|jgi:single-stranded DNA-binding protein|nr:single-stranded DNA-binding protein [Synergistaceae bacterium]